MNRALISVFVAAAMVTIAATPTFGHEDREFAGCSLLVGFLDEPAYEGERNAVSVRVPKEQETDTSHGHQAETSTHAAQSGQMSHGTIESEVPVSVSLTAEVDVDGAVNIHLQTEGWRWAPLAVNTPHEPGAGHAHIYVDGEKISRVYGPDYHPTGLGPGERQIRVALNSNDQRQLTVNGRAVEAVASVTIPATEGMPEVHEREVVRVERLQETLQVEVTHVPSGVSKITGLRTVFGEPGHHAADLIPTSPGHYRFRLFGTIEGESIDANFDSRSGGGDFDDVQMASVIHFPQPTSAVRELESVAQGIQETSVSAEDNARSASTLAIVGIVIGAIGVGTAGISVVISVRR